MGSLYRRDGSWGIDYRDHRGKRHRRVVSTDKSVAQKFLGDALAAAVQMKAGILMADPREADKPIQQHIDAYLGELHRRGRDQMYGYICRKRLEAAAWAQEWECLRDATPRSVSAYLRDLADDGKSPRTVNQHRADLSAFFGWLVRQGALEANPCDRVTKVAIKPEKKRRALAVGECRALLAAAPPDRRAVYLTLLYTGLRRAEAAALVWGNVRLGVANPHVELPSAITKSGRPESVALVPAVAEALSARRGDAPDDAPVFTAIPSMPEFREDLKAAGIPDEDARGRKVVLHSLRHSLATMLAQSQVPPAVAMKIMRHRDVRLTLEAYTDEGLLPAAAAMASLPDVGQLGNGHINGDQKVTTSGHVVARPGTGTGSVTAAKSA